MDFNVILSHARKNASVFPRCNCGKVEININLKVKTPRVVDPQFQISEIKPSIPNSIVATSIYAKKVKVTQRSRKLTQGQGEEPCMISISPCDPKLIEFQPLVSELCMVAQKYHPVVKISYSPKKISYSQQKSRTHKRKSRTRKQKSRTRKQKSRTRQKNILLAKKISYFPNKISYSQN